MSQGQFSRTELEGFMEPAIVQAQRGMDAGHGGPFGACIVKDRQVLACCANTVLKDNDPTAHAEINAIRAAAKKLGHYWLTDCILFSTSLPCPMCTAAIYWARLSAVYYGCDDSSAAEAGFADGHVLQELHKPLQTRRIPFTGQILSDRCEQLFKHWAALKHRTDY